MKTHKARLVMGGEGLHARPSMALVESVRHFDASITFCNRWGTAEVGRGGDLISVLGLAVCRGDVIELTCEGNEAEAAFEKLRQVFLESERFEGSVFEVID
jgi:phosphotransferase system HPr (HPr) family protein